MQLPFVKMHGLGNDFMVVRDQPDAALPDAAAIRRLAHRREGVGFDQLLWIEAPRSTGTDAWYRIFNADGGEVGACGNAARCVADILMKETGADRVSFGVGAGAVSAWRSDAEISVDMGPPKLDWRDIPLSEQMDDTRFIDLKLGPIDAPVLWGPSAVNMGNPHCIFFVDDAEEHALEKFGALVENHPLFPERVNVSVAEVRAPDRIRLRVWERGAGITKACGTAACAALVAAVRRRRADRKARVDLDGGALTIEWRDDDHVIMTGPIAYEGNGVLPKGL